MAATPNKRATTHVEGRPRAVRGVDAVVAARGPAVVVVGITCLGGSN